MAVLVILVNLARTLSKRLRLILLILMDILKLVSGLKLSTRSPLCSIIWVIVRLLLVEILRASFYLNFFTFRIS